MPGYIIHLIEAEIVLDKLFKCEKIHTKDIENWKELFRYGALLPDAVNGSKQMSHFWPESKTDEILKVPNLESFLNAYASKLTDPVFAGYYAHLHLDKLFINQYFRKYVAFLDENKQKTFWNHNAKYAYLKQSHKIIHFYDFFSEEYLYGDYTKMNALLINKYGLDIPEYREVPLEYRIADVDFGNLKKVLDEEIVEYIKESSLDAYLDLRVFVDAEKDLECFLEHASEQFVILLDLYSIKKK